MDKNYKDWSHCPDVELAGAGELHIGEEKGCKRCKELRAAYKKIHGYAYEDRYKHYPPEGDRE